MTLGEHTGMKAVWKLAAFGCVLGITLWWAYVGRGDGVKPAVGKTGSSPRSSQGLGPVRSMPLPGANVPYHGMSWALHYSSGCVDLGRKLLPEIANLGADTVMISNPGYQEHAGSDTFKIDPAVTPSREQWLEIFKIAHDNGLRVILMPIILLSNPKGNEWRGVINPPSWDDWFVQYREFLLQFARIAAEGKVEVLMVGSELVSTERFTDRWKKLISEVRPVFPGKLSYSANWDHYKVVEFWDDLDLVGMTSYYKLSSDPDPTLKTLRDAWAPIKRGLLKWQEKVHKPLLFTEVGWCSQEGTSIEPWNYYYKQTATPAGLEEQRRCYEAFMRTWEYATPQRPGEGLTPQQLGGVLWWEWNDTPGGPVDYNYTPRNKPAEKELRNWFRQIRNSLPATTRPQEAKGR
jgi:hypothetical protein